MSDIACGMHAYTAVLEALLSGGAPCYGEDNRHVLRDLLGYPEAEIERLAREGVI